MEDIRFFCDRCHKLIGRGDMFAEFQIKRFYTRFGECERHLCPDCLKKFEKWMEGEADVSNEPKE